MGGIGEALSFAAGGALGVVLAWMPSGAVRWLAWALLSVALGTSVSWVNGELPAWPLFVGFDVLVVAGMSLCVVLVVRYVRSRRTAS